MTAKTVRVRLATRGEEAEVAACLAAFRNLRGQDEPRDEALTRGVRHMRDRELAEFLLVGRPAHSYAQLRYIYSAWLQGDVCWVEDVYVGDQYRGLGVGRALMRAIESRACELGCVQLQLDANERNEIAVALYESEGYSATDSTWDGGRYLFFSSQRSRLPTRHRSARFPRLEQRSCGVAVSVRLPWFVRGSVRGGRRELQAA